MIKIDPKERTVRECTSLFEFTEKGELKVEDIRIRYFALTWNEIQEQQSKLQAIVKENPNQTIWPHEALAERLESLPDLKGADGKPLKINAKNLGDIDTKNLEAIRKAIDEDIAGK